MLDRTGEQKAFMPQVSMDGSPGQTRKAELGLAGYALWKHDPIASPHGPRIFFRVWTILVEAPMASIVIVGLQSLRVPLCSSKESPTRRRGFGGKESTRGELRRSIDIGRPSRRSW